MKKIETRKAVGHVLCHDITQIVKDEKKGPVVRKGHIGREEHIPVLLTAGKEHVYVWEKEKGMLHENEGARILRDICKNEYMEESEVKEGKIELTAAIDGLFKAKKEKLLAVNCLGEMMIACRHGNTPVKKGDKLAGMRVIPLVIEEEKMRKATEAAGEEPIFSIMPYKEKKVGIVTTGSEVYKGLIKDAFGPVLVEKMSEYPSRILGQKIVDDKIEHITQAVREFLDAGADLILCTGGMSVDPDDCTPGAIRNLGAEVISYGAPVLPGAMLLVAYYRNGDRVVPVVGLPGCVMYAKRTVFDLVLPRIMADDPITAKELALLGEGGLCLNCPVCTYPACGFGKGW